MGEIAVRLLDEDGWQDYRDMRLAALREPPRLSLPPTPKKRCSPSNIGDTAWCGPIGCSPRVTERRWELHPSTLMKKLQTLLASATFGSHQRRATPGIASRFVQAAADQAIQRGCTKLYYWVSTENGRAIGFASNAGFRVTSERRTARTENQEFGNQEIAFVLSLANDPQAVATSTPSRLTSKPGPR
jgi:hypothetical protein